MRGYDRARPPHFFLVPPNILQNCIEMALDVRDGRVGETAWKRWCGGASVPSKWLRVAVTPVMALPEYRDLVKTIYQKNLARKYDYFNNLNMYRGKPKR